MNDQGTIVRYSIKLEFTVISAAGKYTSFIILLLYEIGIPEDKEDVLFVENQGAPLGKKCTAT